MKKLTVSVSYIVFLILFLVFLSFGDSFMNIDVEEFRLDNGLRVILIQREVLPVVSVQLWFRVGAVDEVDGKSGVAHFLEHMIFKGTENLKPGEFSRIVKSMGGSDNAATSHNYTMYYVDVNSENLDKILWMFREILFFLKIDPKEFDSEKKVILEERRMRYEDDPIGQLFEDFLKNSFETINYKRPVIGWENDIRNLTVSDMLEFYNTYYSPKNAVLVISGNIDIEYTKRRVSELFSVDMKNKTQKELKVENVKETKNTKTEFVLERKDDKTKAIMIGFKTPSYHVSPRDVATLHVISYILAEGTSSRMYKELVVSKRLASSVSGGIMIGKYPFLTYFLSIANDGVNISALKEEMLSQIRKLISEKVLDDEIKVAKKKIKADFVFDMETNHDIASSIGWAEVVLGSYKNLQKLLSYIEMVTEKDIKQVLQKYFTENNLTIGILNP